MGEQFADYSSLSRTRSFGDDYPHYSSISDLMVKDAKIPSSRPTTVKFLKVISLLILSGVSMLLCIFFLSSSGGWLSTSTSSETDGSDDYFPRGITQSSKSSLVRFTLTRDGYSTLPYFRSDASSIVKYAFMADYSALIEPYAEMQFQYTDNTVSTTASLVKYSVCSDEEDCYTGQYSVVNDKDSATVSVPCTPFSSYTISVEEFDDSDNSIQSYSGSAICLYVRREIRDLSSKDLESAMDAMYTLWDVAESDGQELYGDNYHDASYFAAAHDFNAAQQDSDHIHEGLGFVPQHIKLTNMFEASVQTVDPSFALPYWDFTIDVAQNLTIYDSYMFTSDTFGTLTKPTSAFWGFTYKYETLKSAAIQDGRWKNLKVDKNKYSDLGNAFGYMRGPWNMNPSPYLTRFSAYSPNLPSCNEYYGGLGLKSFMESLANAKNGPHASTHGVIGAVYGCDKFDSLREDDGIIKDEDSQLSMCKKWGFYLKVSIAC